MSTTPPSFTGHPHSSESRLESGESPPGESQSLVHVDPSQPIPTSTNARAKRHIAALEEELEMLRQERGTKQRKTTYYVAQGRAIRHMVVLYSSLEDLIAENDRRYESLHLIDDSQAMLEQDHMQSGYIELARTLPWLHEKLRQLEHEECENMLKKLKKGADAACGDNTSSLKELVAAWVNQEFCLSPLIKPDDKHSHGFASDICGKLLCPAEWDWDENRVKASICDRTTDYIVSENLWPLFMYEKDKLNRDKLEEGFLKSKLLVLAFKAIFTLPSSAKEADRDGDGADILENNRCAQRKSDQAKVKTCVASIISMKKVTPRAITYIVCQVCFALSCVSSWLTVDGDFDYELFWNNVMDYFEVVPGPVTKHRVDKLLEWWTRKKIGTNHHEDLMPEVVSYMSVNALAEQRRMLEDATFNSE
ncbi:uncharacterized protein F5891DRAFT_1186092 [Suillus fuscotomentosus]|uniref:Uncharacterized protein n=1 Tax=Suillus fuscotomentosus TaxID=1912939 RepID=A0AAD4HNN1_9AGAM|nr:uncharacterized protein F5891DRAFT_1186092 [Suillus fuscotomentosus]KAG1902951.1 hypothetical protein F5891DRAFT_1186092 [Suillus fuscotomentosus]